MNLTFLQAPLQGIALGGGWEGLLMMGLIFVVFYFFLIRPQSKRQKEIKKFQESLEVGKQVVTSGGIYGRIKELKDAVVILEIADGVRIKVNQIMVFNADVRKRVVWVRSADICVS